MAKTLSESAAEILKASMSAAGKEPAATLGAEVQDLGGQTPQSQSTAIGAAASAKMKEAPKPGVMGAPAEPIKKAPEQAKKLADEEEGLKKNPVDTGEYKTEEVVAEEEAIEEGKGTADMPLLKPGQKLGGKMAEAEAEEADEKEEEDDEEEMKSKMKKEMVEKYRGSMREDVDALFNGESLSEDFRVKATLIFESAVQSRVEKIVEEVLSENDAILAEAVEEIKSELAEQVDEYLNYVVEEWVKENEVAIETGLRAELSEDFINGLKNLFAEHYIEIPEEKVDVAEELAAKVVELEIAAASKDEAIAGLTEQVNAVKKAKAINLACEGLTAVQAEKMKSLAESVEFTAEGDFENKLAVLRENYFPSKVNVTSEVKEIQETAVESPEVEEIRNSVMARYVQSITKTAPKA